MINRGRFSTTTIKTVTKLIKESDNVIGVFGESDSLDKGLDGRRVLKEIVARSGRKDVYTVIAKNPKIGMNIISFGDMKVKSFGWKWINKDNLKHPQSITEHYMHHRVHAKFELGDELSTLLEKKYINILAQHQSAFVRPFSRHKQAKEIFKLAKNSDRRDTLTFILRDQNSFLPGEGFAERQLRKKYGMRDLTSGLKSTYDVYNIETDQGDFAHNFVKKIYSNGMGRFVARIVTNADKLDSLVAENEVYNKYDIDAFDIDLPYIDHDLVGIDIKGLFGV